MNLAAWADQVGVSKCTACRWCRAGQLSVSAGRLVLVEPVGAPAEPGRAVVWSGVSSAGQRPGLDRRVAGLAAWVTADSVALGEVVTEIGPAVNGRRRTSRRLLADPAAARVAVGHRDRLARFGAGHLQGALAARGQQIMILGPGGVEDDLVRDMTKVLTSFCAGSTGGAAHGTARCGRLGCAQAETPGA